MIRTCVQSILFLVRSRGAMRRSQSQDRQPSRSRPSSVYQRLSALSVELDLPDLPSVEDFNEAIRRRASRAYDRLTSNSSTEDPTSSSMDADEKAQQETTKETLGEKTTKEAEPTKRSPRRQLRDVRRSRLEVQDEVMETE